jgi:hypothetical protein
MRIYVYMPCGSREEDEVVFARRGKTAGTGRRRWRAEMSDGGEEE